MKSRGDLALFAHELVRLLWGLALLVISSLVMFAGVIIVGLGGVVALVGAGTPIFQSVIWLREGRWYPFTNAFMLGPQPRSSWVGVDHIMGWVWELPLTLGALVLGLAIVAAGAAIGGWGLTIRKRLEDQLRERNG